MNTQLKAMNKIKGIIKKCLFHQETIRPIIDPVQYASIEKSYSGGSLAESNVLVITNDQAIAVEDIRNRFSVEHASVGFLFASSDNLKLNDIVLAGDELIGPFTHVINVLRFNEHGNLIKPDGTFNNEDMMRLAYQWCQAEVDYLVKTSNYATLCTVFIHSDSTDSVVVGSGISHLVSGLAKLLSPHGIICNGVTATPSVPQDAWLAASVFLSGKYGQIMTGEVLNME